jgi:hypothetical protein
MKSEKAKQNRRFFTIYQDYQDDFAILLKNSVGTFSIFFDKSNLYKYKRNRNIS